MPEKVKIHLKNNLSLERNPASNTSSAEKMKKSPYGRYDKSKKTTQNTAIASVGKLTKNEPVKTGFETGKAVETGKSESRQQQIRRARSVGPVVEAAQRELSHLDLTKILGNGNPGLPFTFIKSRLRLPDLAIWSKQGQFGGKEYGY